MESSSIAFAILRMMCLGTVLLYAFHAVRRKYLERKMKLPGLHSTWWSPFGLEYELWQMMGQYGNRGGEGMSN